MINEWLALLVRWAHLVAGIMWIGDSFLFMWLDSHLETPRKPREGEVMGELWLTHGGGFYEMVKRKSLAASELPPNLYWFKWESYSTWITGFLLITIVYYFGGSAMLVDAGGPVSHLVAVHLSLGGLVVGVGVYHLLARTPVAKSNLNFAALGLFLIALTAFGYAQVFNGRAVFLQLGAMLGSIMASNVFFRIIPAQRHMMAATKAGTPVDTSYGVRAKKHSTHNHYLTFPVLFTMLSNHFAPLFGHPQPWLLLTLMCVFGMGLKYTMNFRAKTPPIIWAPAFAALVTVIVLTAPKAAAYGGSEQPPVSFATARGIIETRCVTCHAEKTTNALFTAAPQGVMLDTPERIAANKDRIMIRAIQTKSMPLGNITGMTDGERTLLGAWVAQGANIHAEGPAQLPPAAAPTTDAPAPFVDPTVEAEKIYEQRCTPCHGTHGQGDGSAAAALTPRPRNFSDPAWQAAANDQALGKIILLGGPAAGLSALMPPNPDLAMKPDVVMALVKKVRDFKSAGAPP